MIVTAPPALSEPTPRSEQWWFTAWSIQTNVWPITKGEGSVVAVLDSGVNARLPDLKGTILAGTGIPGGGDGRIDKEKQGRGHGTSMASLVVSQGRGSGMAGIAPNARVLPVRIIRGGDTDWADGIRYAADHGADVINISLGVYTRDPCSAKLQAAVDYAAQKNTIIVASGGNSGDLEIAERELPAKCAGIVAVGAVDARRKIWSGSSPADFIAVAAPGVRVGSIGKNGIFVSNVSGTSQAAALTSGTIALIRSRYPTMPGRQVVQRVIATAKDVGPSGWDSRSGFGMVDPHSALTARVPANAANPVYDRLDRWRASARRDSSGLQGNRADGPAAKRSDEARDFSGLWILGAAAAVASVASFGAMAFLWRRGRRACRVR